MGGSMNNIPKLKFKYLTLGETIIKEIKEDEEEFISKCNNK